MHSAIARAAGLFGLAVSLAGCASSAELRLARDEGSTERRIGEHLRKRGLSVNLIDANKLGDSVLVIDVGEDEKSPGARLVIDTQVSKGERSAPTGRVVLVRLLTHVIIPPAARSDLLQIVNQHHQTVWAGCFFVNERDGELEAQWPINIEQDYSVSVREVEDAIQRLMLSWMALYPKLAAGMSRARPEHYAKR